MASGNHLPGDNATSINKTEELKRLEKILQAATKLMATQVKSEDVAIFIGTTKSGKSSLINYLIGNNLIGLKEARFRPITIQKSDNSEGPQIGCGPTSETIIPTRWINPRKLRGLVIWDAPGFDDNRGPVQDITNAFYIYELFKNIKSVKIVLVADINEIVHCRINSFLSLLKSVENLLKDKMRDCFSSIIVIFTKVPDVLNDSPVDICFITELLQYQILSSSSIDVSGTSKDFVRYLIGNPQNIGVFKKATEGPITSDIDAGIVQAIQGANSVNENILKEVIFPSIAHSSKVFLYEIREHLSSMRAFLDLQNVINGVFENRLSHYSRIEESGASREKLYSIIEELLALENQIKNSLNPDISFHEKISDLKIIDQIIENKINNDKLCEKSKLMEFVDSLLDLKESKQFDFNLQGILVTVMSKVQELIISIKLKLNEIDKGEAKAEVQTVKQNCNREVETLKSELKEAKAHNNNSQRRLGLFSRIGGIVDDVIDLF